MKSTAMNILLCLLIGFPILKANDPVDKNSPFYYDWESLRIGGLAFAGILAFMGIVVLFSGKCRCKSQSKSSTNVSMTPKQPTAGTSEC